MIGSPAATAVEAGFQFGAGQVGPVLLPLALLVLPSDRVFLSGDRALRRRSIARRAFSSSDSFAIRGLDPRGHANTWRRMLIEDP